MARNNIVDILVVEDSECERVSIVESLQSSIPDVIVTAVHSGEEALDFLFCRNNWIERVSENPPKLILMDLALPGSDGFSVLGKIRSIEPENEFTLTPVVIFTDSHHKKDITKGYRCGVNSYIIKPISIIDFQDVVKTIGQYWMNLNKSHS